MKRILAVLLATLTLASSPAITVCANEYPYEASQNALPGTVSPMWDKTYTARAGLSANGTTLSASAYVRAKNNKTSCSGYLYIDVWQGGRWENVTSWYISGTGKINTSRTLTGTKGRTYRGRFSVSVGGESISATSSAMLLK